MIEPARGQPLRASPYAARPAPFWRPYEEAGNEDKDVDLSTADRCADGFRTWLKFESARWLKIQSAPTIYIARDDEYQCPAGQRAIYRFTREEGGLQIRRYWTSACPDCPIKVKCTPSDYRRISRWEHEPVVEAAQRRLDKRPDAMTIRRRTVEHVFGTLKHWMGSTHFLTRGLANVATEMSLHVLAYNLKRVISILGMTQTMKAMKLVGA